MCECERCNMSEEESGMLGDIVMERDAASATPTPRTTTPECGFEWERRYVACDHRCQKAADHDGEHCCKCGARKQRPVAAASPSVTSGEPDADTVIALAREWYASSVRTRGEKYRAFCEAVARLTEQRDEARRDVKAEFRNTMAALRYLNAEQIAKWAKETGAKVNICTDVARGATR
jgi:hypothetical protein